MQVIIIDISDSEYAPLIKSEKFQDYLKNYRDQDKRQQQAIMNMDKQKKMTASGELP